MSYIRTSSGSVPIKGAKTVGKVTCLEDEEGCLWVPSGTPGLYRAFEKGKDTAANSASLEAQGNAEPEQMSEAEVAALLGEAESKPADEGKSKGASPAAADGPGQAGNDDVVPKTGRKEQ